MRLTTSSSKRAPKAPEPAGAYPLGVLIASAAMPAALSFAAIYLGTAVSPASWYIARASGLTLYILLWVSAMLGLGMTTGMFDRIGSRAIVYSLHRFVTALSYGFLSAHLLSLLVDPTVSFGLTQLLVPFNANWGEPWTGLGVLAMYLLAVIALSSALIRRISHRTWKAFHRLAFPMYVLALAHGIGTGTDTHLGIVSLIYWVTAGSLVFLILVRVLRAGNRTSRPVLRRAQPFDRMSAGNRSSWGKG